MTRVEGQSGLIYQKLLSSAGEVLDVYASFAVDATPDWFTYSQEVGPQTADGVLGYISQRLASSSSKHIAAHSLVDTRHVLGPHRLVLDARQVNRKALAADNLQQRRLNNK